MVNQFKETQVLVSNVTGRSSPALAMQTAVWSKVELDALGMVK